MKKKNIYLFIFIGFIVFLSSTAGLAQKSKENFETIKSVVKDEKGIPVKDAKVYGNEGTVLVKTDSEGRFTISIPQKTDLLIEAEGHESTIFNSGDYDTVKELILKTSLFGQGEKDIINIAFGKVKSAYLVNDVTAINPGEIRKYDNIQAISEALTGRVPGMLGGANIRGLGTPMYVVDGLPRDINTIDLSEVEQISVLKDINSSVMYGNAAVNGVIQIKTKRGAANRKDVNVTGYYGISTPKVLPKYLSSADYMTLYNEAKVNDGLAEQYTPAFIENYKSGNPYRYPNVDYYSKDYLKDYKTFSRITTELSGGNDVTTYYTNVGWNQSGSLLNFGAGDKGKMNKFNVRGNVDIKINDWIKTSLDAVAVVVNDKGPIGTSYWTSAAVLQPQLFSPLLPFNLVVPNDPSIRGRKNDVDGMYLLGGTAQNIRNPIANGYSGGDSVNVARTLSFNNRIDFDLGKVVKGLAFHTNISFDFFTRYDQAVKNTYAVYVPVWKSNVDSIASFNKVGDADSRSGNQIIQNPYYERRFGFYGMLDYNRNFGVHQVNASIVGYGYRYKINTDIQGNKNVNLGMRLAYSYKNQYLIDFSSAYVNSVKLPEGNNRAFSPTLGLAWIVKADKGASSDLNYLKVRGSAGLMNSEMGIDGFYYYDNSYTTSGSFGWYEGGTNYNNNGVISSHAANLNLGFEKRNDLNLGVTAIMLDHKLSVDANVFTSEYYDQITRPATIYPSFYTNFIPYQNFESNSYRGAELGLSYKMVAGDFSCVIGVNALLNDSKVVKKDEINVDSYQNLTGRPIDARFGLVSEGFFADQSDINGHAFQAFGTVKPGDLKYVDQNKDGIIDVNDKVMIGRSQAPLYYGINIKLAYKNLTLFARGTGSNGADGYLSDNYYWVDGTDKYSEFILNRWTPATATTATSPRLSSLANSNNYQPSSFWLYDNSYFSIDRIQLTYDFPVNICSKLGMKNLSLYANGSSLMTISKNQKYLDLKVGGQVSGQTVAGQEPNYRSFSLGVITTF